MSIPACDPDRTRTPGPPRDEGAALIITLMVLALLSALSTTVAVVTIQNLQSSVRVQRAGVALNAAEAGVSQAISYLRSSGVRTLACSPTCGTTNPWGDSAAPKKVSLPGGNDATYQVWIERKAPLTPTTPGVYRIHSRGTTGTLAKRDVTVDVTVSTLTIPKGIFARTVSGGGSASVQRASIISTGCVYNRGKISFSTDLDAAYGIPPAVHSSQTITTSSGSGQYCPTTRNPIHDPTRTGPAKNCATAFPYDQDRFGGGDLGTGTCAGVKSTYPAFYGQKTNLDADADVDVDGSFVQDDAALLALFGVRTPVLTQAQLDQLRTVARSQGNYHEASAAPSGGWSPDERHAVMFFNLAQFDPGGVVDLNRINGFERPPQPATCPEESLIIVIEGGNAKLNANKTLVASLFLTSTAPYGQVLKANGTADFIGSISADSVDLTGNIDVSMDSCFVDNPSPALLELTAKNYREVDR